MNSVAKAQDSSRAAALMRALRAVLIRILRAARRTLNVVLIALLVGGLSNTSGR